MDFNDNPFYLLKAKTTDDKKKLLKLAEESLINNDSSKINAARLILSNPKKRIFAECSWFLGEDNKNLDRILKSIKNKNIKKIDFDLTNLSAANFFAYSILNSNLHEDSLFLIKKLIIFFDFIDTKKVLEAINEDRKICNIKVLQEAKDLNEELNNLRRFYISTINNFFDKLTIAEYSSFFSNIIYDLYSDIKDEYTLLAELVDRYELNTKQIIDEEEVKISMQIDAIEKYIKPKFYKGNISLGLMTDKLIKSISEWVKLVKPIQVNFEHRGLLHAQSRNLAIALRTLIGDISNLDIDLSLEILIDLKRLFIEVSEIKDLISQDINALTIAGAKIKHKRANFNDTREKSQNEAKSKSKTQSRKLEKKYKNFSEVRDEKKTTKKSFKKSFFELLNSYLRFLLWLGLVSFMVYFGTITFDDTNQSSSKKENNFKFNKSNFLLSGNRLFKNKNYTDAIEYYKKALDIDPNYYQAIYNIGLAFYLSNNYSESNSYLRKIILGEEFDRFEKKEAFILLGDSLYMQEDYSASIEAYTNGIKLDLKNPNGYLGRGRAYKKIKEFDLAEDDFLKTINLGMKTPLVYRIIAAFYFDIRNYKQSIFYYDLAIKNTDQDIDNSSNYFFRGYSKKNLNKISDACQDFDIALKLSPENKNLEKIYQKNCNKE